MTNEEIQAMRKRAFLEGWEIGWVTRHADEGAIGEAEENIIAHMGKQ